MSEASALKMAFSLPGITELSYLILKLITFLTIIYILVQHGQFFNSFPIKDWPPYFPFRTLDAEEEVIRFCLLFSIMKKQDPRPLTEAMKKHPESLMNDIAKDYGKINGRVAYDAAKQGDEAGKNVVKAYGKYVAAGIVSIVNIFQPDKVVIGGGVSNEGEYLINPVREHVKKYDFNRYFDKVKIETATLKNDAGIVGAALIAKK